MSSIFQTPEWEKFKLETGYSKSFRADDVLILKKDLPMGRSMLYSPMVPENQEPARSCCNAAGGLRIKNNDFWDQIRIFAKAENAIFYRVEFDIPTSYKLEAESWGIKKSFEEMQPEHTLVINLAKSEEEILAQMKQKGRYNIKIAEKNNILVRKTRNIDNFYDLYGRTGKRHKITFRNKNYFQALLDNLEPKGYGELFEAYGQVEGKETVLASAICTFYKGKAIYLFGASSDEHKNLMAPYKLQWEMIREAMRRQCTTYDFFGIAPEDKPNHPWAGVTRFKKQFGGEEIEIHGSYDKVFKPLGYKLFKIAEKLRRK